MQVPNYEEIIMEERALLILKTVFQACVWLICSNQIAQNMQIRDSAICV